MKTIVEKVHVVRNKTGFNMVTPGTLTTEEAQILTTTPPQPPMELGHQLRVEFLYKIVSDHKNKKSFKKTLVSTEKDMLL